jgi:hypothetical protein
VTHRSELPTYLVSNPLVIGCESYSVPEDISDHVDLIRSSVHHVHDNQAPLFKHSNTTLSKAPSLCKPTTDDVGNCDKLTTPQCLRALYSIDHKPKVPHLNSLGIGVSLIRSSSLIFLTPPSRIHTAGLSWQRFGSVLLVSILHFIVLVVLSQSLFQSLFQGAKQDKTRSCFHRRRWVGLLNHPFSQ